MILYRTVNSQVKSPYYLKVRREGSHSSLSPALNSEETPLAAHQKNGHLDSPQALQWW